jgi:phage terminase small subunit
MKLTAKQDLFAREYTLDLNASAAAIRSGYAKSRARSQGSVLLRNVAVAARVSELLKVSAVRSEITVDWVVAKIKEVAGRCLQEQPVVVNGQPTGEWRFDASNGLKALELLGRHVGMFSEKAGDAATPPLEGLKHFRALLSISHDSARN